MSAIKLFYHYHQELVDKLPMKDEAFLAELRKSNLLHEDASKELESHTMSRDRATYFLDNVIKLELRNNKVKCFNELLNIMKDSKQENTTELSKIIKSELKNNQITSYDL